MRTNALANNTWAALFESACAMRTGFRAGFPRYSMFESACAMRTNALANNTWAALFESACAMRPAKTSG
jgi:hypothetical protein